MCGIAGIIDYSGTDRRGLVTRMLTRIHHRGPDESGIYASPHATIGNVRLSIIDIASGQQPLSDTQERYWIVFNGELFNYIELRDDLVKKGYTFKTKSDTEVIIQLYACYGKAALSKMNGQFAFAIWDKQKEELFIARDRIGIRPFFYCYQNRVFTFGSEIKAIFENSSVSREFSSKGLHQVFTFWTSITPNTVFKDIYELSPGHYMTVDKNGIKTSRYWRLNYEEINRFSRVEEAVEEFDSIFQDAVRIRLRADVEVAAYLSGGLDSSVTTAYIKKIEPSILHTFSIGFNEDEFDETKFQNEASRYLDTDHKSIVCSSSDIANKFPDVVWHSETPLIRTAPTPMYLLSGLVRSNNIKVVITGEGADEMLAGYNIFKESEIRRFWSKYPNSKIRPLLLKKLYPYLPQMQNVSPTMLKLFFGYKLEDTQNPLYSHLLRWNNASHIKKHFQKPLKEINKDYDPFDEILNQLPGNFDSWNSLAKSQYLEASVFLSGYLLSSQGDRMGMGNSIEGRYPFLDHRLMEFCNSLPPGFKLNGLSEKFLLKKLIRGKIPESIVNRSKQAYRAPIATTFLGEGAPEYVKEALDPKQIDKVGVFDSNSVKSLLEKVKKSEKSTEIDNMSITAIISTYLIYNQFLTDNYHSLLAINNLLKPKVINDMA